MWVMKSLVGEGSASGLVPPITLVPGTRVSQHSANRTAPSLQLHVAQFIRFDLVGCSRVGRRRLEELDGGHVETIPDVEYASGRREAQRLSHPVRELGICMQLMIAQRKGSGLVEDQRSVGFRPP